MAEASRAAEAPAYDATARALLAHVDGLPGLPARPVIGVAGESGSGKSVTALALARALAARGVAAAVLHQDDYFHRPPRANHEHRRGDLARVGPHEVNLALVQAHVAAFRARRAVDAPLVDYPSDRFLTRRLALDAVDALVVEGTYALLLDDLDVRVFLTATHEQTRASREARARDVHEPFVEEVLRLEHALIAPQAARADLLVDVAFRVHRRAPG